MGMAGTARKLRPLGGPRVRDRFGGFILAPAGAKDRSHGWSPPTADGTRGHGPRLSQSAPAGAAEVPSPLPGRVYSFCADIHGFRFAPPVATILRPFGATRVKKIILTPITT